MAKKIKRVVIVGGGSAGWMTAAYLTKALDSDVDITLVESSSVTTIGVGEATFSTIKVFFDYLGLEEHEWMPKCNATYKTAIKFVDWNASKRHFFHPFQRHEVVDGFNLAEWWLKGIEGSNPFDYSCFVVPTLCDAKRSPRYLDGSVFDEKVEHKFTRDNVLQRGTLAEHKNQYPYAYHFDANLLARFMKEYALQRGAVQVVADMKDVIRATDGRIESILTTEGPIEGDLFIDCTGFRSLLLAKALEEPFISFSDSLLCDRAIAMQIPVDIQNEGIEPFTTSTALSSGWVWNIPLYGRIGTGYVYSSAFLSREEAEAEFRQHLGMKAEGRRVLHIDMRIGRHRNSWVKNCVAIGLSSGFVEPLESTGIFFIQHGIEELVRHFPDSDFDPSLLRSYNESIANCIDGVREFLTLHYVGTDRADTPFWRAAKTQITMPRALEERMQLWKKRLPCGKSINPRYHGFEAYSYSVMLLGLGYRPEHSLPVLGHMNDERAKIAFSSVRNRAEHLRMTLPSQYDYLTHVIKSQEQSEYLLEGST